MGNTLGWKRSAKVMKINGETFKTKAPIRAGSILEKNPGHVLLESEAVKHFGVRAKPLEPYQELKPRRLYFLVELPKLPEERGPRRVRSGIQMTARDRLESLMLARRSSSDLSILKPTPSMAEEISEIDGGNGVRVKMRLPKAEVDRLMAESKNGAEVAEKIVSLCMTKKAADSDTASQSRRSQSVHGVVKQGTKSRERRVGFMPITEGEIQQLVVAS